MTKQKYFGKGTYKEKTPYRKRKRVKRSPIHPIFLRHLNKN
jgi:hypothetical protein